MDRFNRSTVDASTLIFFSRCERIAAEAEQSIDETLILRYCHFYFCECGRNVIQSRHHPFTLCNMKPSSRELDTFAACLALDTMEPKYGIKSRNTVSLDATVASSSSHPRDESNDSHSLPIKNRVATPRSSCVLRYRTDASPSDGGGGATCEITSRSFTRVIKHTFRAAENFFSQHVVSPGGK